MKKKLVTYLLISALAVTVFAGCGKKDDGGDAAAADAPDAGAVETVVTEDAPEETEEDIVEAVEETVEADAVEATTAIDAAAAEAVEAADTAVAAVAEEYTDETEEEAAETAATDSTPVEVDKTVLNPGDHHFVIYGGVEGGKIFRGNTDSNGNLSPDPGNTDPEELKKADDVQDIAEPGWELIVRNHKPDTIWYYVEYWKANEGVFYGWIEIE